MVDNTSPEALDDLIRRGLRAMASETEADPMTGFQATARLPRARGVQVGLAAAAAVAAIVGVGATMAALDDGRPSPASVADPDPLPSCEAGDAESDVGGGSDAAQQDVRAAADRLLEADIEHLPGFAEISVSAVDRTVRVLWKGEVPPPVRGAAAAPDSNGVHTIVRGVPYSAADIKQAASVILGDPSAGGGVEITGVRAAQGFSGLCVYVDSGVLDSAARLDLAKKLGGRVQIPVVVEESDFTPQPGRLTGH